MSLRAPPRSSVALAHPRVALAYPRVRRRVRERGDPASRGIRLCRLPLDSRPLPRFACPPSCPPRNRTARNNAPAISPIVNNICSDHRSVCSFALANFDHKFASVEVNYVARMDFRFPHRSPKRLTLLLPQCIRFWQCVIMRSCYNVFQRLAG